MDIHPWTNYEIARLRNEERLVRAGKAQRALQAREMSPAEPSATAGLLRTIRRLRLARRRRAIVIQGLLVIGVLASASIALAHGPRWAWTERKAEQIVTKNAVIRLPPPERASLENELRMSLGRFQALELATREEGRINPAGATYRSFAFRYRSALRKVRSGLEIEAASCTGSGVAAQGHRFRRFRCSVRSEELAIPSAIIVSSEDGKLPAVVEAEPKIVGPLQIRLSVRVTGESRIASRRIG